MSLREEPDYLELWVGDEDTDSQPHGIGVALFHGGDRYTGQMSHGRREGWGVNCRPGQQVYAGYFKADRPEGQGCLLDLPNSTRYEGLFELGTLVEGRLTDKDGVIEGRWVASHDDKVPGVLGRGRKLDIPNGLTYEGEMEGVNTHGLGRIWMEQRRYVGYFNKGALHFCRSYSAKVDGLYIGQCAGSRKQGLGARLFKDGRFHVGFWDNDKPSIGGAIFYLQEGGGCVRIERTVYHSTGELQSTTPATPNLSAAKLAAAVQRLPLVNLDSREAVMTLLQEVLGDPSAHAHKAMALLNQLREESKRIMADEPPKVKYVPYQPDLLRAPEEYWGDKDPDGLPHGRGVLAQSNGNIYEGSWQHGKRHGQGKQLYSLTGEIFDGQWQTDNWHSGCWTSLDGRTVQADHYAGEKLPHGLCIITHKPKLGQDMPVKLEAFYDKGRLQVNDVRITNGVEYIFRGTVHTPDPAHQFDVPLRRHGLVFYGDEDGSMYEGDFDEQGRKSGVKGFLVQRSGEQVVYEGPFNKDVKDGGIGVELHRATGRPYLIEMPFQRGQKHGRGYRATESCTNIKEWRFENDQLVEVRELGARQDERLLRVFQQLTKRIVRSEAEWPAKIHGPFTGEERDKPKDGKQNKAPALPTIVRKARPTGSHFTSPWGVPSPVESDIYEGSARHRGSPPQKPPGAAAKKAAVAPPEPSPLKNAQAEAKRPVSPLELGGDNQDFAYHAMVRSQREIPPLQIPEFRAALQQADAQGGGSSKQGGMLSPSGGGGADDFQEVVKKKKAAQANKAKDPPKVKVTALVEPGWKAALVRVILEDDVEVSHYTVNYFEVSKPAFMRTAQRSDIPEIVIKGLKNNVKYGFNVQVTYWNGNQKMTAQAKETVRTTPPGAVKTPPPPDNPDRLFVRPMGEDGQVLPLNDGQWPFAAYILGKEVAETVLANKKYSVKVRLLHGDGHLAVEFCLAREIQEHAKKFTVWCREKPLALEEGFRISAGASPVLIAGLRNGVTYDVSFKIKWSSGRYYPAEPASIVIEGRPEGAVETLEAAVNDAHLVKQEEQAHETVKKAVAAVSGLPVISQLTGPSPFDFKTGLFQALGQPQQPQQQPMQATAAIAAGERGPSVHATNGPLLAASPAPSPPIRGQQGPGVSPLGPVGMPPPPGLGAQGPFAHQALGAAQNQQILGGVQAAQQPASLAVLQQQRSPLLQAEQQKQQYPEQLRGSHLLGQQEPSPILQAQSPLLQPQQQQSPLLSPLLQPSVLDGSPLPQGGAQKPMLFERCKVVTPPSEEGCRDWSPAYRAQPSDEMGEAFTALPPPTFGGEATLQWNHVSLFHFTPWVERLQGPAVALAPAQQAAPMAPLHRTPSEQAPLQGQQQQQQSQQPYQQHHKQHRQQQQHPPQHFALFGGASHQQSQTNGQHWTAGQR